MKFTLCRDCELAMLRRQHAILSVPKARRDTPKSEREDNARRTMLAVGMPERCDFHADLASLRMAKSMLSIQTASTRTERLAQEVEELGGQAPRRLVFPMGHPDLDPKGPVETTPRMLVRSEHQRDLGPAPGRDVLTGQAEAERAEHYHPSVAPLDD